MNTIVNYWWNSIHSNIVSLFNPTRVTILHTNFIFIFNNLNPSIQTHINKLCGIRHVGYYSRRLYTRWLVPMLGCFNISLCLFNLAQRWYPPLLTFTLKLDRLYLAPNWAPRSKGKRKSTFDSAISSCVFVNGNSIWDVLRNCLIMVQCVFFLNELMLYGFLVKVTTS